MVPQRPAPDRSSRALLPLLFALSLAGGLGVLTLHPQWLPAPLGGYVASHLTGLGVGGALGGPVFTLQTTQGSYRLVPDSLDAYCSARAGQTLTVPLVNTGALLPELSTVRPRFRQPEGLRWKTVRVLDVQQSASAAARAELLRRSRPCDAALFLSPTPEAYALLL